MSTEVIIIGKEKEKHIEFLWHLSEGEWARSNANPKIYGKIECLPYKHELHIFIAHYSGSSRDISIFKGKLNSGKVG